MRYLNHSTLFFSMSSGRYLRDRRHQKKTPTTTATRPAMYTPRTCASPPNLAENPARQSTLGIAAASTGPFAHAPGPSTRAAQSTLAAQYPWSSLSAPDTQPSQMRQYRALRQAGLGRCTQGGNRVLQPTLWPLPRPGPPYPPLSVFPVSRSRDAPPRLSVSPNFSKLAMASGSVSLFAGTCMQCTSSSAIASRVRGHTRSGSRTLRRPW